MNAANWTDRNHRHLVMSLALLRARLDPGVPEASVRQLARELDEHARAMPAAPALTVLQERFGLSGFELSLLLTTAGVMLDGGFGAFVHELFGGPPTFGLAMAHLPDAHWSAMTPNAPLRRWNLVRLGPGSPVSAPLSVDEQIAHSLVGLPEPGERTRQLLTRLRPDPTAPPELVDRLVQIWSAPEPALAQLDGSDAAAKRSVAAEASAMLGSDCWALDAHDLPDTAAERAELARHVHRDALLLGATVFVDAHDVDEPQRQRVATFLRHLPGRAALSTRDPVHVGGRPGVHVVVDRPDLATRRALWIQALGREGEDVDAVAAQFGLGADAIRALAQTDRRGPALWEACRRQARSALADLAQRIETRADWSDLVLPDAQTAQLRQIVAHVRHRYRVHHEWGLSRTSSRGLGISALFWGPSGTGKTLAAEILAGELGVDCYRVDLSALVSKYIGETESNLRRVFDAAEAGGALLLFDEADALFGKRHEVGDSRDRYANMEVGYLLQRVEAYTGLVVLTTNLRDHIDEAFLRRIRFSVRFPFPSTAERKRIWRRCLPDELPTEGLDFERLAQLKIAGGNIRSIVLNAAFLAADAARPLGMDLVLEAARAEYAKLGRPLSPGELAGWP